LRATRICSACFAVNKFKKKLLCMAMDGYAHQQSSWNMRDSQVHVWVSSALSVCWITCILGYGLADGWASFSLVGWLLVLFRQWHILMFGVQGLPNPRRTKKWLGEVTDASLLLIDHISLIAWSISMQIQMWCKYLVLILNLAFVFCFDNGGVC
jgi:hypothetical protein